MEVPERGIVLHQLCIMLASREPFQLQKKTPVSCREAKRLVTQWWSPRFVTSNTVIVSKIRTTGY